MAINVTDFLTRYPNFTETNTANAGLIDACLTDAMTFVDATRWGNRYEAGVFLKAAHLLSMHPFGQAARLSKTDTSTIYSVMFDDMKKALPVRMMSTF